MPNDAGTGGAAAEAIPVHLGAEPPAEYARRRAIAVAAETAGEHYNHDWVLAYPAVSDLADLVNWAALDLKPRWVGDRADDCSAAIEPNHFHGQGADELARFVAGAWRRRATPVVVATMRSGRGPVLSVFGGRGGSVWLPGMVGSVAGTELPPGGRPELAEGLDAVDKDLALRVRDGHPADGRWWALELRAPEPGWEPGGGPVRPVAPAPGVLSPLLVNSMGEAVAAVWTPDDNGQRWYVLPDGHDWSRTLGWLSDRALPVYAPGRLREARSSRLPTDAGLLTAAERAATEHLAALERDCEERLAEARAGLAAARAVADPVREAALWGTGKPLVDAVARILGDAGMMVVDLDEELGGTRGADLLATLDGRRRLVEVKYAGGAAAERLVDDLRRHLRTWPGLRPDWPVEGGSLVVNHDGKTDPAARPPVPHRGREFVASLEHPVVGTIPLYRAWAEKDWPGVRRLVFPGARTAVAVPEVQGSPDVPRASRTFLWRRKAGGG